jgi:murein L,D-transpeptidase YcbB/YkuD
MSVKTSSDLDSVIRSLEPPDNYYHVLKSELAIQIALNNDDKIRQLNTSMNLHRWIQHFKLDKYIVINAGSATLRYYEHNTECLFSKVIVGKPSTRTPRFAAYCNEAIFYPYWNVPRSIAVKELLPHFKRSLAAIDEMNMEVIDKSGKVINPRSINWAQYNRSNFPYSFRQQTGCDNSLGVIKFNLSDPFDVYLHDTNAKKLFESKYRYYSHGCIRIEKAIELGNMLLSNKIDDNYLISCLKDQKPVPVQLDKPVPVFVIYATAEVDDQGAVQYNKDVYHLFR